MAWRDCLRAALAQPATAPHPPINADANSADCANSLAIAPTEQQTAQLAQLTAAHFQQIAAPQPTTAFMSATAEQAADEAADRAAIEAEPLLPPPGSPERNGMDRRHAEVLDGYRRAALQRPPA
jgi:hypothetical protein